MEWGGGRGAFISNGSQSCFNHPRQVVLDSLQQVQGIEIYQTNKLLSLNQCQTQQLVGGNVPDSFIADPETTDSDGTITITVAADSYTVSMPAKSFSKVHTIERE